MHTSTIVLKLQKRSQQLIALLSFDVFYTFFQSMYLFCFDHDVHVYSTSIFQIRSFQFQLYELETNKQNQKYLQFLRFVLVLFQFRRCVMMLSVVLPRVLVQISAHFMIRYYLLALDTNVMCEKCPSNKIKLWPTINLSFLMNEVKRSKFIIKQSLRTSLKCLIFCVRLKFFGNLQW